MTEIKDISNIEDFETREGDIGDYHEVSNEPVAMNSEFMDIFTAMHTTGMITDVDTNEPLVIAVSCLYQTKIPNNYNRLVYYMEDKEKNLYKLALLDFNDDDCSVYAKIDKTINKEDLVKVIPPRMGKPRVIKS